MITEKFEIPSKLKTTSTVLMLIGVLTLIVGGITLYGNEVGQSRFWVTLLLNSIFFLFLSVISVFILAAAGLAQGGWITAYRRIPEAIGSNVWKFALICLVVMACCLFVAKDPIYHWMGTKDPTLERKALFLNPVTFFVYTIIIFGLWSFFGIRYRNMSIHEDSVGQNNTKIYWKMVAFSGGFMVLFALSMMSLGPWMWIMSLEPHWFSTLFSWYVFASAFVSGMALILLFVVYLKNQGYLGIVNKEHIHDLGKFMFAFSIFWTYLWFAQYLLIWYGNIPIETTYFKIRQQGPYSVVFYANIVINFVMPILILMSRPSKRNYFIVIFMAIAILFGHWLDFYQMMVPGVMGIHWSLSWYEIGVTLGFAGVMIKFTSATLAKANLIPSNNPFLKESIVHIS